MSLSILSNQKLPLERLSVEEMENPGLVFQQFFKIEINDLPEVKQMLWQIFKDLTKRQYKPNVGSRKYDNTLYFFEKIEKVIEAAYLMH